MKFKFFIFIVLLCITSIVRASTLAMTFDTVSVSSDIHEQLSDGKPEGASLQFAAADSTLSQSLVNDYRKETILLFQELMRLIRDDEDIHVKGFGVGSPKAHDWLVRTKEFIEHLDGPEAMEVCFDLQPFGFLNYAVCPFDLLSFVSAHIAGNIDSFEALAGRFWMMTLCSENPRQCMIVP